MTPQIRLQKQQLSELQEVRQLSPGLLHAALAKGRSLPPTPLSLRELKELLDSVGIGERSADALIRQLMALHGLVRQLDIPHIDIFEGLEIALQSSWSGEEYAQWRSISALVVEIFELDIISLSAKAFDLSYEHSELLRRARILTDIRPVFNKDASEVSGAVISHTLLLRYDDTEGDHILSLAVDEDDIHALIKQCERALVKSRTAKSHLEAKASLRTIIPGENAK